MPTGNGSVIATRPARSGDAEALARVRAAAWEFAYAGLIPQPLLSHMGRQRTAEAWRRRIASRGRPLVVELGGRVLGYAEFGTLRGWQGRAPGEIYELYLDPVAHGAGLGRRLFAMARRVLERSGHRGLLVRSLAGNEIGCRFYRALGGREAARYPRRLGGRLFEEIAFRWP